MYCADVAYELRRTLWIVRMSVNEIKLYLIHRIQRSPKRRRGEGLRQSTAFGFYGTFQMVYSIETKCQLWKATNEMINNVSARRFR